MDATLCSGMAKQSDQRRAQGDRLKRFRKAAGFRSAREAALENEWRESSYRAHEGGTRTIGQDDAERYARRFAAAGVPVSAQDILFGAPEQAQGRPGADTVSIVGAVHDGGLVRFDEAGRRQKVRAPQWASSDTVALEIRTSDLGSWVERWVLFFDDRKSRAATLHEAADAGRSLFVCGLSDKRVVVRRVQPGRARSTFHLLLDGSDPIADVKLEWAERVREIRSRDA